MCEYCHVENDKESLRGDDGIYYDKNEGKHILYIEHFQNEVYKIAVNYCSKCGRDLKNEIQTKET